MEKIYRFMLLGTVLGLGQGTFSSCGFSIQIFIAFLNWCLVTLCVLLFMWFGVVGKVRTTTYAKIQVTDGTDRSV